MSTCTDYCITEVIVPTDVISVEDNSPELITLEVCSQGPAGATNLEFIGELTKDITGFIDRTTSSIAFDDSQRLFTLQILSPTTVYKRGKRIILTEDLSVTVPNTAGGNYIRYNPDTESLEVIGSQPDIRSDLLVGYVYWSTVSSTAIIVGDERHAVARDTQWHYSEHRNRGAVWRSGGALTYTLNNASAVNLSLTSLSMADEDLDHSVTNTPDTSVLYGQVLSPAAYLPVIYLNGTSYTEVNAALPLFPHAVNGRAYRNQITSGSGSLVEVSNNKYFTYWIICTNDSRNPVKLIMGHSEYANIKDAEAEVFTNYGLPIPESFFMYKLILQAADANTGNISKVTIQSVVILTQSRAVNYE